MADGVPAILLATSTMLVAYASWWLLRHELAVRRFRAQAGRRGANQPG
jgi:hypothetical protein